MNSDLSIAWCGPTCDHWEWISSHFKCLQIVPAQNLNAILESGAWQGGTDENNMVIVLASDSRHDSHLFELTRHIEKTKENSPLRWCVLLGPDWVGHRRTHPLPDTWQSFYWYELYDRWIPWLLTCDSSKNDRNLGAGSGRPQNQRVQHWIDAASAVERASFAEASTNDLALVVTHTEVTRSLWIDALAKRNIRCVCVAPERLDVWMEPNWIIIDLEPRPLQKACVDEKGASEIDQVVTRIKNQFSKSLIAVADNFPRWDNWQRWIECGAHVPFGKPYFMDGLIDTMGRFS